MTSDAEDFDAWNNFVMGSQPEDYSPTDSKHSAALAKNYMNGALGGGINSFLTNSWEFSGQQVLNSLNFMGAVQAAKQFADVLERLGVSILTQTQDERWHLLDKYWPENVDDSFDMLSDESEKSLMFALEKHVQSNEQFYRTMK